MYGAPSTVKMTAETDVPGIAAENTTEATSATANRPDCQPTICIGVLVAGVPDQILHSISYEPAAAVVGMVKFLKYQPEPGAKETILSLG